MSIDPVMAIAPAIPPKPSPPTVPSPPNALAVASKLFSMMTDPPALVASRAAPPSAVPPAPPWFVPPKASAFRNRSPVMVIWPSPVDRHNSSSGVGKRSISRVVRQPARSAGVNERTSADKNTPALENLEQRLPAEGIRSGRGIGCRPSGTDRIGAHFQILLQG